MLDLTAPAQTTEIAAVNPSVKIGKNRYGLRLLDRQFETSKRSGNPMIVFDYEVCRPNVITVDGKQWTFGGYKLTHYLALTEKNVERIREFHKAHGISLDVVSKINPTAPDLEVYKKGLLVDAILGSEQYEERTESITQPDGSIKLGELILDDDGKPIIRFRGQIREFLGISKLPPEVEAQPF